MTRRFAATLAATLAATTVAIGAAVAVPAPAVAAPLPIDQCTTSSGVILAVDFRRWGGSLLRSCGTTPTTGYQLLNQGGWKTTGTQHDGPAFICRIGYAGFANGTQYPTAADEQCILTPPAGAYWSYWHADPGANTWTYSQLGAMSYQPKPGSVDLWIFGGTNTDGTEGRPAFTPDSVRAHNSAPATTARPANGHHPPAPLPNPGVPGNVQAPPGATAPPGADPSASMSPTGPASSGTAAPAVASSAGPSIVDAVPTTATASASRGSARPLLITLGALVMLGIGGIVLARRRRHHATETASTE